jgi:hypothetical protein
VIKSGVKSGSLTVEQLLILVVLRGVGACGTSGGAVKCVDIGRNAGGESDVLDPF